MYFEILENVLQKYNLILSHTTRQNFIVFMSPGSSLKLFFCCAWKQLSFLHIALMTREIFVPSGNIKVAADYLIVLGIIESGLYTALHAQESVIELFFLSRLLHCLWHYLEL